ncbi:hypothetical protein CBR_g10975 [Chara braunii]|uniref:Uncharacterized protein n=1 Tax=Chara braunii TaxID=69332 RepID=A0A388KPP4_CHABU|nr:hypothetical protein CBR_g10975 [Chara braunii]|eukprot:GBG72040.1 hypothetical protein CBR_g10975 [Chara braunii]
MKTYLVRFDGGSRGNPGVSGSGAVLYSPEGRVLSEASVYVGPQSTNNVAEFEGLIVGLRMAIAHRVGSLRAEGDSELIIKQMNGVYRVRKPHLVPLYQKVRNMADRFDFIEFVHIERAKNHVADALANKAMDERRTRLPSIFRGLDAVEAGEEEEEEEEGGRRDFASLYNGGELRYSYGYGDTIDGQTSSLRPLISKKRDLSVMTGGGHSTSFAPAMGETSRVSPSSPDTPMEKRPRSCEAGRAVTVFRRGACCVSGLPMMGVSHDSPASSSSQGEVRSLSPPSGSRQQELYQLTVCSAPPASSSPQSAPSGPPSPGPAQNRHHHGTCISPAVPDALAAGEEEEEEGGEEEDGEGHEQEEEEEEEEEEHGANLHHDCSGGRCGTKTYRFAGKPMRTIEALRSAFPELSISKILELIIGWAQPQIDVCLAAAARERAGIDFESLPSPDVIARKAARGMPPSLSSLPEIAARPSLATTRSPPAPPCIDFESLPQIAPNPAPAPVDFSRLPEIVPLSRLAWDVGTTTFPTRGGAPMMPTSQGCSLAGWERKPSALPPSSPPRMSAQMQEEAGHRGSSPSVVNLLEMSPMAPLTYGRTQDEAGALEPTGKFSEAPFCTCGKPSVKRCVKKEGPNRGRFFYVCADTELRCKFFQWMDDDERGDASPKKQGKGKELVPKGRGNQPSASYTVFGSGVTEKERELFCGTRVNLRPEHGGGVRVSYPYHPDRNEALKKRIDGYKWLPETKEWFCPEYSVPTLRSFLRSVGIPFPW